MISIPCTLPIQHILRNCTTHGTATLRTDTERRAPLSISRGGLFQRFLRSRVAHQDALDALPIRQFHHEFGGAAVGAGGAAHDPGRARTPVACVLEYKVQERAGQLHAIAILVRRDAILERRGMKCGYHPGITVGMAVVLNGILLIGVIDLNKRW